jgi:hypothetical protein
MYLLLAACCICSMFAASSEQRMHHSPSHPVPRAGHADNMTMEVLNIDDGLLSYPIG